jgi:signal peptidase I
VSTETRARPGSPGPPRAKDEAKPRHPVVQFFHELPGLIVLAFVLAILIKTFLFQAFYIPTPSMVPTLRPGDKVIVVKVPYWFHDPRRGDIVVFEETDRSQPQPDRGVVGGLLHWLGEGLGFQAPDNPDYIKRVIGVPGDVVSADGGKVYVNGVAIDEPYLRERTRDFKKTRVPDGKLFVMGDNRNNSLDSRPGLGLGFVPIDRVVGKAFLTIWPIDRMNPL